MGNILQWLEREVRGEYLWCIIVWVGTSVLALTGVTTWVAWVWDLPLPLIIQVVFQMFVFGVALIALFIVSANGLAEWWARKKQTAPVASADIGHTIWPGTQPIEFYDSRTEKGNSLRGGLVKELSDSSEVWIAMIAGAQIREISSILRKFSRIIINDPESEQMKRIALIQPKGEDFFELAKMAIRTCRNAEGWEGDMKLSDNFVLNVVISDPNHESRAWARVQTFLPYKHGDVSPSYVVQIKDRPKLFKVIKESFEEMYKAGKPLSPSEEKNSL